MQSRVTTYLEGERFLCYRLVLWIVVVLQVWVGQSLLHAGPARGGEGQQAVQQVQAPGHSVQSLSNSKGRNEIG
jgi:hypothetical protein